MEAKTGGRQLTRVCLSLFTSPANRLRDETGEVANMQIESFAYCKTVVPTVSKPERRSLSKHLGQLFYIGESVAKAGNVIQQACKSPSISIESKAQEPLLKGAVASMLYTRERGHSHRFFDHRPRRSRRPSPGFRERSSLEGILKPRARSS